MVLCTEMFMKMLFVLKSTVSFLDYYLVMLKISRLIIQHSIEMHSKLELVDGIIIVQIQQKKTTKNYSSIHFRTLGGCLQDSTHCYTLEVSFFSYQTPMSSQAIPYTEDLCKRKQLRHDALF